MDERKIAQIRKSNMKLYPIYKMIGLDWIFYYGIRVLFLTQVKNIQPADIILSSSFYAFCYILFQIPNSVVIEKIGKRNAVVMGQLLNFISMCIILFCPNFIWLLVSQAISAIGFGIKTIAESNLLNASLPQVKRKGEIFSKIDSRGYSKFCFIGATSILISGFLYSINPYIPICLCLLANFTAFIIATNFIDIEKEETQKKKKNSKEEIQIIINDLKTGFKFIFTSKRLRTLLIILGIWWGIINTFETCQETLLKELEIPSYYIGFILAGFQMLVGIFATKSIKFNKKHKNRSLTYIGLLLSLGSIILGIITIFKIPFEIQLMIITSVFIARAYAKGIYQVLKKRYMNNFANNKILPKIYSINGITANLGRMIIGIIASSLLKITILPNALLYLGIICTIIVISLGIYSKSRLGLKPQEYDKKEIEFSEV